MFTFIERRGTYAVGVTVREQYDHSRAYRSAVDELGELYRGERARPMQIVTWYPAEPVTARAMTVRDYGNLWATETSFGNPKSPALAIETLASMNSCLESAMWAVRDAPQVSGRFPVVIYAPSFSAVAWENADLCEYLASHGYVVIATASLGAHSRAMSPDLAGVNAQAADIGYLLGYAHTLPIVTREQLGSIGFSWGGLSNVVAASRDDRIQAVVALDGSLRYFPGLTREAAETQPEEMRVPLMYFAQHDYSLEEHDRNCLDRKTETTSVLNAWTEGDLFTVHMLGLSHEEFGSMPQRSEDMWKRLFKLHPMMKGDYGREDGVTGYAWMARYTLEFLNAYLKHDRSAQVFLGRTPAENGVPPHVMAVSYRPASTVRTSLESFRLEIGRRGFDQLEVVYAEIKEKRPQFKLDEDAIVAWSEELLDTVHIPEAISVLKLNVRMHPDSSGAYAWLGRAHEKAGDSQLAIENYRKAVAIHPVNVLAQMRLMDLLQQ